MDELTAGDNSTVYKDYVIVGTAGMGKTLTSNKFVGCLESFQENHDQILFKHWTSNVEGLLRAPPSQADRIKFSESNQCQLISNEASKIRVLDIPGFVGTTHSASVSRDRSYHSNLQIFYDIIRIHQEKNLVIQRFIYFLPFRGAPEKADGILQDELSLLYFFYGEKVFDNMAVVATKARKYQGFPFTEDEYEQTKKVLMAAIKKVTSSDREFCPLVVYISLDEEDQNIRHKLEIQQSSHGPLGLEFQVSEFANCSKCKAKVFSSRNHSRNNLEQSFVITETSQRETVVMHYEESKCHPFFTRRYSMLTKILGGLAHVITLGIPFMIMKNPWPGIFNADTCCVHCRKEPGTSPGCTPIYSSNNERLTSVFKCEHAYEQINK